MTGMKMSLRFGSVARYVGAVLSVLLLGCGTAKPPFVTIPSPVDIPVHSWPAKCTKLPSGRCAPAVIITGAKKCGTNSLNAILKNHPYARYLGQSNRGKRLIREAGGRPFGESWYFDCALYPEHWVKRLYNCTDNGPSENTAVYSQMFDDSDWQSTFAVDRSPLYNIAPGAGSGLAAVSPSARIVLVLCDPVKRAWSSINHENKRWLINARHRQNLSGQLSDRVDKTLEQAVAKRFEVAITGIGTVLADHEHSYQGMVDCVRRIQRSSGQRQHFGMSTSDICREVLLPGFYFDGLQQFIDHFPAEQLIVVHGEWLFSNQREGARQLYRALGVPTEVFASKSSEETHSNEGARVNPTYQDISQMPDALRSTLLTLYNSTVRRMFKMFGNGTD